MLEGIHGMCSSNLRKEIDDFVCYCNENYNKDKNEEFEHILVEDINDRKDRILLWEAQNGNDVAKEYFILDKMDYVRILTSRDSDIIAFKSRGLDDDDLFQTGIIGVLDTIKKYDFRANVKVNTYLTNNVKFSIRNMYRQYGLISISREAGSIYKKCSDKISLIGDYITKDDIEKISREIHVDAKKIESSINAVKSRSNICTINIDGSIECDVSAYEKYNMKTYRDYLEKMDDYYEYISIIQEMKKLSKKEYDIIKGIYIEDRTQKDLSEELNISVPAVGKIKKRAIEKMKKGLL